MKCRELKKMFREKFEQVPQEMRGVEGTQDMLKMLDALPDEMEIPALILGRIKKKIKKLDKLIESVGEDN